MAQNVIIIGAGGHAKVVADIVINNGDKLLGFLDDNKPGMEICGAKVLGALEQVEQYSSNAKFVIAIGSNHIRKQIADKYDLPWYSAVHPGARISSFARLGSGTVIMANAVVNAGASVGMHCIVNTSAVVDHDCVIEDYVHISPNATLCGTVTVGELTHIGAAATIRNNTAVCGSCIVGAGAVVVQNIVKPGTYIGVPAKKMQIPKICGTT